MSTKAISVASWNILIEGWKAGAKPCLKDVSWEERRELIVGRVSRMGAHVICLQEVDRFDSLAEKMAQVGYYGVFAKRNNGQEEGCALFYKHKDISILKINGQEQEVHFFNDGTGRMIQKVAIKILSEQDSAPITFLNTHIVNAHSYPNNIDEGVSKRTEELRQLALNAAKCSEGENSVIVCGDLNVSSEQEDRAYLQGFKDNGFIDSFDGSVNANKPTVLFSGTHKSKDSDIKYRRIDFVFSKNMQCLKSDVRGDPKNLENKGEPSDHLAILCQYAIPKQQVGLSPQLVEIIASQLNRGDIKATAETLDNLPYEDKMRFCQLFAKTLIDPQKKLEEGIDINQKVIAKIQENFNEIFTGGGYSGRVPTSGEVQWISRENFFVFSLKSNPQFIFKLALVEIQNRQQFDSNGKLMNSQQIVEERFNNMIRAKQVCLTHRLDNVVIPHAKKFSVNHQGKTIHFIAEERLDFDYSGFHTGSAYNDMLGDETAKQLAIFIAKTGLSDIKWENMSILKPPLNYIGQKKIALFDLEHMENPQGGFFGHFGSAGLIRCLGSESQINTALDVAKQHNINPPPHGKTIEKIKNERLEQIAWFQRDKVG